MAELVTALTSALAPASLLGELTAIMPFVGGIAVFSFGVFEIRKVVKGAAKGKVRI